MLHFILNQTDINTTLSPGTTLLDFIRYHQQLTGTKIGCREGDCGACTILVGEIKNGELVYSIATSCLMAIGNAHGKHIVSIEGINLEGLNAVQQAFADEGATQCGFCTPGFIVSLTGFCISNKQPSYSNAIDSMNGNICRCTGYKSIERAAGRISSLLQERKESQCLQFALSKNIIPAYFLDIKQRLQEIKPRVHFHEEAGNKKFLAGGTDLYVQQHESMLTEPLQFLFDKQDLKGIRQEGNNCIIGGAVTLTDMAGSEIFLRYFPRFTDYIKLISSTPIRNMATIAGNFSNASPIGDLTIFFLALDTKLVLDGGGKIREIALRNFYKGYKTLDKEPGEIIREVHFKLPAAHSLFNFEKVSKRTWLDIASVNTALYLEMNEDSIVSAGLSAGGVGPVPMFLPVASKLLEGKRMNGRLLQEVILTAQEEIAPISDARGSEEYKRLLLTQLIKAHIVVLFPELPLQKLLQ